MKLRPEQVAEAARRQLLPVYLVAGDEPLLVAEALDDLRAAAREQGFDSRDVFVAERGFAWSELFAAGQSLSLFSEKRIIDLRLPTGKPGVEGGKAIAELAERPPEDTILLISAPKLEAAVAKSKWVKAIDAAGAVVRVWPLEARELPGWITQRLQRHGLQAERDAVLSLARQVEGNLLAAQQEIDKLALLHGDARLTAADIDAAVANSARYTAFKLADEVLLGRSERALRMLGSLRREGVAAPLICWALTRDIRDLSALQELVAERVSLQQAFQRARVWSSRQGPMRHALSRLDLATLYQLVALAERCDRAAKGQSGEDVWALLAALTTLATSGRPVAAAVGQ